MALRPYEELAPEPLAFPINGKVYTVPPVGYREGLRLTEMIQTGPTGKFEESAEDVWRMVLGPTYDQMKADNVPGDALARAAFTALTDFQFGRDAAEVVWESGLDPKALSEAMAKRTAAKPPASTRSRSTASAPRTKTASTRRTTSRTR
jgi:hypothetical protein